MESSIVRKVEEWLDKRRAEARKNEFDAAEIAKNINELQTNGLKVEDREVETALTST